MAEDIDIQKAVADAVAAAMAAVQASASRPRTNREERQAQRDERRERRTHAKQNAPVDQFRRQHEPSRRNEARAGSAVPPPPPAPQPVSPEAQGEWKQVSDCEGNQFEVLTRALS